MMVCVRRTLWLLSEGLLSIRANWLNLGIDKYNSTAVRHGKRLLQPKPNQHDALLNFGGNDFIRPYLGWLNHVRSFDTDRELDP